MATAMERQVGGRLHSPYLMLIIYKVWRDRAEDIPEIMVEADVLTEELTAQVRS